MAIMLQLVMFLHILGAIVAFGFGFYAPIFGMATAKEPQHGNWYLRTAKRLSNVIIIPFALSMAVTGYLLVAESGGPERFKEPWLAVAIVLYVIALAIVFLLQRPTLNKLIALTEQPPGPEGPPAEVGANVRKLQLYGVILLVLTIAIVALMVWKPGL